MSSQNKSRFLRTVLVLSLLANVACGVFLLHRYLVKKGLKAWVPPPKLPYYLSRDKLFESLPVDTGAIVFLGTSLTQYYEEPRHSRRHARHGFAAPFAHHCGKAKENFY